jgi:hypothetical protein
MYREKLLKYQTKNKNIILCGGGTVYSYGITPYETIEELPSETQSLINEQVIRKKKGLKPDKIMFIMGEMVYKINIENNKITTDDMGGTTLYLIARETPDIRTVASTRPMGLRTDLGPAYTMGAPPTTAFARHPTTAFARQPTTAFARSTDAAFARPPVAAFARSTTAVSNIPNMQFGSELNPDEIKGDISQYTFTASANGKSACTHITVNGIIQLLYLLSSGEKIDKYVLNQLILEGIKLYKSDSVEHPILDEVAIELWNARNNVPLEDSKFITFDNGDFIDDLEYTNFNQISAKWTPEIIPNIFSYLKKKYSKYPFIAIGLTVVPETISLLLSYDKNRPSYIFDSHTSNGATFLKKENEKELIKYLLKHIPATEGMYTVDGPRVSNYAIPKDNIIEKYIVTANETMRAAAAAATADVEHRGTVTFGHSAVTDAVHRDDHHGAVAVANVSRRETPYNVYHSSQPRTDELTKKYDQDLSDLRRRDADAQMRRDEYFAKRRILVKESEKKMSNPAALPKPPSEWTCAQCTFENDASSPKCAMCDMQKSYVVPKFK